MSVLIRNIKMPEDCYECLMCQQRFDGYREETRLACSALEDWAEEEEGRLDNCPLIEVPPHGRLIDADFEEQHYTSMTTNPTPDVTEQDRRNSLIIIEALQMAKTVIEAED